MSNPDCSWMKDDEDFKETFALLKSSEKSFQDAEEKVREITEIAKRIRQIQKSSILNMMANDKLYDKSERS